MMEQNSPQCGQTAGQPDDRSSKPSRIQYFQRDDASRRFASSAKTGRSTLGRIASVAAAGLVAVGLVAAMGASAKGSSASAALAASGYPTASPSGDAVSGPPTINALFGTRNPRQCASVTHKPSAVEAAALVQCAQDSQSHDYMTLYNNVNVTMGGSRPYQYRLDSGNSGIDTTAPVYPIRGSLDQYVCHQAGQTAPGQSCLITHWAKAEGSCIKTTFGDWHCTMIDMGTPQGTNGPAPTTY